MQCREENECCHMPWCRLRGACQRAEGEMQTGLRVGDKIKDNDPRMANRVLIVKRLWFPLSGDRDQARVIVDDSVGRPFSILLRRIYTDGKPRRSGFDLVV